MNLARPVFILGTTTSSTILAVAGEAADHALTANEIEFVIFIAAGVAAIATIIAWIDRRIDLKIKEHNRLDRLRHQQSMTAVHHLHQLVALKLGVPPPQALPDPEDGDAL